MTTTPGAAAAAVGAGADPACMQATTATHFMAFVVPEGSVASGAALSLHAPKVGGLILCCWGVAGYVMIFLGGYGWGWDGMLLASSSRQPTHATTTTVCIYR
jgi:hypothetical protein